MDKKLNTSASNPSKTWECIKNRLLINSLLANNSLNNFTFVNDYISVPVLNENINLVDNYELNRVNYNRI